MSRHEFDPETLLGIGVDVEIAKQKHFLTTSQMLKQMLDDPDLTPDQRATLLLEIQKWERIEATAVQIVIEEKKAKSN